MKVHVAALFALVSALAAIPIGAQTQRALLIGINIYQPAGTTAEHPAGCIYGRCELGAFQNLDGAVNDAQAMADLLTSPKFGFPASQVVLLTNPAPPHPRPGVTILPACETTRDGILAAMQKYLVDLPQQGRHRGLLRRQSRLAARQQQGQQAHRAASTASMCTPTARWCPPTHTRAATTCATGR